MGGRTRSENESIQPFPSLSLNNDPQLEFLSVTTRRSNAGLLVLWLILCTQGHEDFNLLSWHRRRARSPSGLSVCASACVCACARTACVHAHIYLSVFSYISTLLSPKSPILMSCHWQLLPTLALTLQDGRGQSVLLCVSARIRTGREDHQNVRKKKKKKNPTNRMFIVA